MSGSAAARDRPERGTLSVTRRGDTLVVGLAGGWRLGQGVPAIGDVQRALASPPRVARVTVDASALGSWDSGVVTFLAGLSALCREHGIAFDRDQLPSGLGRLLALAEAVPEKKDAKATRADTPVLERVGEATLAAGGSLREILAFLGELTITIGKLFRREARFRNSDLFLFIQQVGVEALPIVTLITFLVGAILAFVGAVQLEQFGAQIYVADLVGIAMVREMGAIMTAIVMAGRSGAAFAAQLGSMTVNQEIDALSTMGISPLQFLVLPRVIALFLMMPLLCLYADLMGILGGAAVGIGMLGLSPSVYFQESANAIGLDDLIGGVFKASVYGVLVAMAGCLRGMQSGKSSSAVGDATTAAVVTSIVWVITACGLFAVIFYILGI
jgi:phospholipid/cholesterol/gamma-HCH transport system permease protein